MYNLIPFAAKQYIFSLRGDSPNRLGVVRRINPNPNEHFRFDGVAGVPKEA